MAIRTGMDRPCSPRVNRPASTSRSVCQRMSVVVSLSFPPLTRPTTRRLRSQVRTSWTGFVGNALMPVCIQPSSVPPITPGTGAISRTDTPKRSHTQVCCTARTNMPRPISSNKYSTFITSPYSGSPQKTAMKINMKPFHTPATTHHRTSPATPPERIRPHAQSFCRIHGASADGASSRLCLI